MEVVERVAEGEMHIGLQPASWWGELEGLVEPFDGLQIACRPEGDGPEGPEITGPAGCISQPGVEFECLSRRLPGLLEAGRGRQQPGATLDDLRHQGRVPNGVDLEVVEQPGLTVAVSDHLEDLLEAELQSGQVAR